MIREFEFHVAQEFWCLAYFRRVSQVGDYVSYCSLPCTLYESLNK